MRILIFLISLLLTACGGSRQTAEQERIESFATGVRRVGATGAVLDNDRFEIGSLSKALTGSLIARLVEQKKLRGDETLAEVFPAWHDGMQPQFKSVTIEQLLQHRSGLPYDFEEDDIAALLPIASATLAPPRAGFCLPLFEPRLHCAGPCGGSAGRRFISCTNGA